ncbi:GNAT family N-acetyltransferase [Streptomyces sp. NPDC004111]|uniref:GNAT family N-acetyltransferase n=1 Tax=Streptomyces sp. NPDC004111 TaxID=3364690 RepID=UPI003683CDC2
MKIVDLAPGDPRLLADLLPVLRELRPHLTEESFTEVYAQGHPAGLRFSAGYDDAGVCVGAAGWRVVANTSTLRMLYVDDLVTADAARSTGVGARLLEYLQERAAELGCREFVLDSGTQRTRAHQFYLREKMEIVAFHFAKDVPASSAG